MTLETLTFQQILLLANSHDFDSAEFGHRAIRLLTLAVKILPTDEDQRDIINLDHVLRANLANEAFVAHLLGALGHTVEVIDAPVQ